MHHVRAAAPQLLHGQAVAVQRHRRHRSAAGAVDAGDLAVAGILHAVGHLTSQKLHQQAVQHLGAGAHDDLLRAHRHAPELAQMVGDGAAQRPRALGRRGVEKAGALLQNGLAHEPRPDGEGEVLRVDGVGDKVKEPCALARLQRVLRHGRRLGGQGRQHGADEVALFLHAGEIALGHELLVGVLHGDDADLQMGGQRPLAGQLLPRRQTAGEDILLDAAVQLLVQADAGCFIQCVGEHGCASYLVLTSKIKMDILIIPVPTIIRIEQKIKGQFTPPRYKRRMILCPTRRSERW